MDASGAEVLISTANVPSKGPAAQCLRRCRGPPYTLPQVVWDRMPRGSLGEPLAVLQALASEAVGVDSGLAEAVGVGAVEDGETEEGVQRVQVQVLPDLA